MISVLGTYLKRNTVLKELWLAHNDLTQHDAYNISLLLKSNFYIQYLDISNNYIADLGVKYIVDALIEQASKLSELLNQSTTSNITTATAPSTSIASTDLPSTLTSNSSLTLGSISSVPDVKQDNVNLDSKNNDVFEKIDLDTSKTISGRSKLDVLLQQSSLDATPTPSNNDLQESDIIVQKTNVDLLNTIYEHQALVTMPETTTITPAPVPMVATLTTSPTPLDTININENIDTKQVFTVAPLQDCTEKLDPVTEETEAHLEELERQEESELATVTNDTNTISNNEPNELFNNKNNENTNLQIIVQDLIPNNFNADDQSGDDKNSNINDNCNVGSDNIDNKNFVKLEDEEVLSQDSPEDMVVLKIVEEKDNFESCDNNNPIEIVSSDSCSIKNEPILDESITDETPEDINRNIEKPPMLNIIYDSIKRSDKTISNDSDDFLKQSNDSDMLDKSTESFEFIDPNSILLASPSPSQPSSVSSSSIVSVPFGINEKPLSASFDDSILLKYPPQQQLINQNKEESVLSISPSTVATTTNTITTITDNIVTTNVVTNKTSEFPICDLKIISVTTDNIDELTVLPDLPPPERSFSSDSINSDTSIDSNDSKSSIRLTESKFAKNGTLERQPDKSTPAPESVASQPTGLQVLILWNNQISRHSSKPFAELLSKTNSLDILNVGHNVLNNDFLANIKTSLKSNTTVTNLGLQSAHLSCAGIKHLAEVIEFGGNSTLQRIDLRDNNIEVAGLTSLEEALKNNKSVTQIDLDEPQSKTLVSNLINYLILSNLYQFIKVVSFSRFYLALT